MLIPSRHPSLFAAGVPLLAGAVVLIGGCGTGPSRYDVSGTVTYGGEPVPAGRVLFTPDSSRGGSGPAGTATIVDGRYDTAESGRGHTGGPIIVQVDGYGSSSPAGAASPADAGEESPSRGEMLFLGHQVSADLPEQDSTFDIDVPAK